MVCLEWNPNKRISFVGGLHKESLANKAITDTKSSDQNKYKEWIEDQFSVWDISQIDLDNLEQIFK
jgi:hypothetical protein